MRKKGRWNAFIALFFVVFFVSACSQQTSGSGGGVNIAVGPPASETQSVAKKILEAYGVKDGDYKAFQEGFGDALNGVQDGNIAISFGILGVPTGSINELQAAAKDVKMLSLSDEAIAHIEKNTSYKAYTIPKGSYDFLDSDVKTVTAYAILVGNTNTIDEKTGYELTKYMYEKASENTHAQAKEMTLKNALNGSEGLPIHPGAKKYFEEKGLKVTNPVATLDIKSKGKQELILGTGSQGGTYYPLGGELANIWKKYASVNITNTETSASLENLANIREGTMDLGMSVHVPAQNAIAGKEQFEGNQIKNVAFMGHIYPEVIQIVTRKSTGINSLEDIVKK
ncbi:TAXI family TRAP transporter solute-binding subunit [Aneurinibacillus sp. REN35]|uniref:TAXI family TRAP transporter solute-binding subunit n=1 Tax=Aneurinibacillus sp. REN35 TaxID=3237286 RepID=UPI0035282687